MSGTKSILVPLDGSATAERAVPVAAAVGRATGSPLTFFHAIGESVAEDAGEFERARKMFDDYARRLASRCGVSEANGPSTIEIRQGSAAKLILDAAASSQMIVIASHGRGGFHAAIIGSVADKVVRGATLPVLVVPGTEEESPFEGAPVLIAVDGSDASESALTEGRALAAALKSPVTLVRAYNVPPPVGVEFSYYPVDLMETMQQGAEEYLQKVALPGEGTYLAQGQPWQVIIEAAKSNQAGLVVMASAGKGLASRLTLGSQTDRVLHSLHRPLLIVPIAE